MTPGDDVRVVYDSRYDEISGIAEGPDGEMYVSATTVFLEQVFGEEEEFGSGYGDGSVYRTTEGGGVVELWYSGDAPITALGVAPSGDVWVGTGLAGRLYAIGAKGEVDVVAELDDEQILSIAVANDRTLLATGLSGAIHEVEDGMRDTGTFESDVLDARSPGSWGEITWRYEAPDGSHVDLHTRSGNTTVPDATWSDWSAVEGDGQGTIESLPARCLQWKAELRHGRGESPVLHSVEAAYLTENLAPRVVRVGVLAPGEESSNDASDGNGSVWPSNVMVGRIPSDC